MYYLLPVTLDDVSLNYLYQFRTDVNPDWKKAYVISCLMQGLKPYVQGAMDDFAFFKLTEVAERSLIGLAASDYLLIVNNKPVCSIRALKNNHIVSLFCITNPKYQNKGYAQLATKMVEDVVFENKEVIFISIKDMSSNGTTTHIAEKLGYIYDSNTNTFAKVNPNLSDEEIQKMAKDEIQSQSI